MDSQAVSPRWLRTTQMLAAYGIGRRTLWRWVKKGCPCVREEGILLFCPDEVDAWLRRDFSPPPFEGAQVRRRGRPRKVPRGE